ncbi:MULTISPECIES: rhodanese-like domain-containing protein [Acidovorax]|uniref:Phage shock protein E n=1 Tax=Acidovorax soli TaxID=592050 RepID=A0A1H4C9L6_9BURK|nr:MULTISPECIES: rhodanese-like domain-containing protein [Acidovorax]SEA57067.1 phage shock protein E [Acidovorax soli]
MEPNAFPQPAHCLVVDVRSPGEFASGHVDGAINLPLDRLGTDCAQALPDKSTPLVLCCLSGARSGMAAQWLSQQGYAQVTNGGSVGNVSLQLQRPIRRG